jgi:hypothetical protein
MSVVAARIARGQNNEDAARARRLDAENVTMEWWIESRIEPRISWRRA